MKLIIKTLLVFLLLSTLFSANFEKRRQTGKKAAKSPSQKEKDPAKSGGKKKKKEPLKGVVDLKSHLQNIFDGPAVARKDLPDVPVYFEGWVKYFHYKDQPTSEKPKSFFRNDAFYVQSKRIRSKAELSKKDKHGYKHIPSDSSFWVKVLKDNMNVLSSREEQITRTVDSLNIDFIKAIPETNRMKGGVRDFGKFNEGHCLQVLTVVPQEYYQMSSNSAAPSNGESEVWIFCTEKKEEKRYLMASLIGLKIKKQHVFGHFIDIRSNEPGRKIDKLSKPKPGEKLNTVKEVIDGYWVLLQDWSQCTLKCGGGHQYQHLLCVPPKDGGKPCQGTAIRTRTCNTKPCPPITRESLAAKSAQKAAEAESNKPIVKAMRVSERPLRYDKCHIKEGDVLMSQKLQSAASQGYKNFFETFPGRMVMNNRTITVYQDESYKTILATFMLASTKLVRIQNKANCFKLISNSKKLEVCEIQGSKGNFVEEWDYDFNLFKFQCKSAMPEIKISSEEEKKLQEEYNDKVKEAKMDVVRQRQEAIKQKVEKNEEILMEKKVEGTQSMTLQAVQKELELEELLEKEEKMKEEMELDEINKKIKKEKKKDECLTKVIKQRELEDQFNLSKSESEKQIEKLKEEAKQEIIIKRNMMKTKIMNMRKKNERKKNMMMQKLMHVRSVMATKIQKASKVGSKASCELAKNNQEKINAYCENNFFDNFFKLVDCKDKSNFCYACCENEFGDAHVAERDNCYDMCDGKLVESQSHASKQKDKAGKWIWTNYVV